MADRDVLFRIGLANHPDTQAKLRELSTQVQSTMRSMDASIQKVGTTATQVAQDIPTQIGAGYEEQLKNLKNFETQVGGRFGQQSAPPTPPPASRKSPKPVPAPPDLSSLQTLAELQSQVEALEKVRKEGEVLERSLSGNFREIAGKAEESASGLGQLASGVAFLFADSEDAKALIDTLLKIKGTADIALGGFKTLSGGVQVLSLLRDRSRGLSQQQQLQAQQTQLTAQATLKYVTWLDREKIKLTEVTNGNKQHAAALRYVANEAKRAALAEEELAASQTKANRAQQAGAGLGLGRGRRAGRGRGVVGGIASLVGFEAIGAVTGGNSLATGVGAIGLDALISGGGGGIAAGGGSTAAASAGLGGLAVTAGAAVAALGGIALVGKEVEEIWNGTSTQVGSLTDTIASTEVSVVSWIGEVTGAFDLVGNAAVKAAEEFSATQIAETIQRELSEKIALIDLQGQQRVDDDRQSNVRTLRELRVGIGDLNARKAADLNTIDSARELAKAQKTINDYQTGRITNEQTYVAALKRAQEISKRLVKDHKSQISAIKAEGQERQKVNQEGIKAARERLSLLDKELEKKKEIAVTSRDQLNDSAQRFAQLSQKDQAKAIQAQQLAQSGRASELTRDQRDLLGSIGTDNASRAVRRADIEDAREAGFFRNFGNAERARIQQAAQAQQGRFQVRAEIVNRQEINVNLEENTKELARQIVRQIRANTSARNANLQKEVELARQRRRQEATDEANANIIRQRNSSPT